MESDAERAAFYQAHKHDPEGWAELERPKRRGREKRLISTITVRFSPEETDLIRREAERTNSTYSEVVRRAVHALGQPWHAEAGTTTNLFVAGPAEANQGLRLESDGPPEATRTGRMAQPR